MNGKDLLDKINFIDNDLIEEAANIDKKRKPHIKLYVVACFLCVILIGTVLIKGRTSNDKLDNSNSSLVEEEEIKNSLVYIPNIEVSEKSQSNICGDMIAFIIYKDKMYERTESFKGQKVIEINNLVGNKVGYAKGDIEECFNLEECDEEFPKDFSGSVSGNVYTVNGYSEDFRICIKGNYKDDNGNIIEYIDFYENLYGIGLNVGKDLFEDRLNLKGNWHNVKYFTHHEWISGWPDYNCLDLTNIMKSDIDKFIQELNSSEFVDLTDKNIYDNTNRHLYIYMKDNTSVKLKLLEGGYVGYEELNGYFVKMPGAIFDKLYEASE